MPRSSLQAKREADLAYIRGRSQRSRDIAAEYPEPGDLETRAACEHDLRLFLSTYFPAAFRLEWSDDHLRVIDRMQEAILEGGLFCLAMSRGSGKTTCATRAALWALLYGHRRFICLVGATERKATELLKKHLKHELTFNARLVADFRQVCYPLVCLENNGRRIAGQLFRGEQTRIEWSNNRLTFPTMPDDACDGVNVSGSTVTVASITGALRGQSHTLPSGEILRPELVILDDPQTRESATSPSQSAARAEIVRGDVLGMAGPGERITVVMPCTIIRANDLAAEMLDRQRSPKWHGMTTRMLDSLPTNEKLWDEFKRIRDEDLRRGGDGSEATAFYAANREAMDEGAVASWPARYEDGEMSAIQHAMTLKLDDESMFAAEYQNEPITSNQAEGPMLTADAIARKLNGIERGVVPVGAEYLTCAIDVHDTLLYFAVCAWSATFTGWVISWGSHPDQHRRYYTMRKASRSLQAHYRGTGREGAIRAGLDALTAALLSQEFQREDGAVMRINRCVVDSGYMPDIVSDVCRHSTHAAVLMPSRGVGIGASGRPISEYDRTRGDRIGWNWYIPRATDRGALRVIRYDANFWKSFVHARLAVALVDEGCLSLHGRHPDAHRLLADHLTAETPVRTHGQGRSLDEWRTRPDRADNHLFDVITANAAAASLCGAALPGTKPAAPRRERVSFAELQRRRQAAAGSTRRAGP